jgi:hypothetical protein
VRACPGSGDATGARRGDRLGVHGTEPRSTVGRESRTTGASLRGDASGEKRCAHVSSKRPCGDGWRHAVHRAGRRRRRRGAWAGPAPAYPYVCGTGTRRIREFLFSSLSGREEPNEQRCTIPGDVPNDPPGSPWRRGSQNVQKLSRRPPTGPSGASAWVTRGVESLSHAVSRLTLRSDYSA